MPLLVVRDLVVEFPHARGKLRALDRVSFTIDAGEVLGVVGESGAGKTLTGAAITGLVEPPGQMTGGEILLQGERIDTLPPERMRLIRGGRIGTVFQDPLTALDPLQTIGRQLIETIRTHLGLSHRDARHRAIGWLEEVGIPGARARFDDYPHTFSGGMRQRVVIALALCAEPSLVIADEPTTSLDMSVQGQIIELLKRLTRDRGMGMMLVTHDMGVIAEMSDRVAVMYAGRIAEMGPVEAMIRHPAHPYTIGLMGSVPPLDHQLERLPQIDGAMPRLDAIPPGCAFSPRCSRSFGKCGVERPDLLDAGRTQAACWLLTETPGRTNERATTAIAARALARSGFPGHAETSRPILELQRVSHSFAGPPRSLRRIVTGVPRRRLRAVDDVTLAVPRGATVSLVGESGCGKSTLARLAVGLLSPRQGSVRFDGQPISATRTDIGQRRRMNMIFQDPYASLDPRWLTRDIIAEPIRTVGLATGAGVRERVDRLLTEVGLAPQDGARYPHAFSGGQRQRIAIARALAAAPDFLVCDEPTSGLDVSVQAQILNLLRDLQRQMGLTYLFISHNIAVVRQMSDQVGVMYLGRIVEFGAAGTVLSRPLHPYARLLLSAVPDLTRPGTRRVFSGGEVPDPLEPPSGCTFHPRCPKANERCRVERPEMVEVQDAIVACHAVQEGRIR